MQYVFDDAPDVDGVLAEYPDLARAFMNWCADRTTAHQQILLKMPGISGPMHVKRLIGDTFLNFRLFREEIDRNRDEVLRRLDAGEAPREIIAWVFEYLRDFELGGGELANYLASGGASGDSPEGK